MNVFYTNQNPIKCASEYCLVHQRKMIVEYAQMLSTAHHVLDGDNAIDGIYKKTHSGHPSTVWIMKSSSHYQWVLDCAFELCRLYTDKAGKVHKTESILLKLKSQPNQIKASNFIEPPAVVGEDLESYAKNNGVIKAYQEYLIEKFEEWQSRKKPIAVEFINKPEWINQ